MNESQARQLESILGGEAWQKPNEGWVVTVSRGDGGIVMVTESGITEYASDEALDSDQPTAVIPLSTDSDDEGWWVVVDEQGNAMYRDAATQSGWRWKEEAEQEARGLQSRTGDRFAVRRLEQPR